MGTTTTEALLNSNPIIEFNTDGVILEANKMFLDMMGYTREELILQPHSILLPPADDRTSEFTNLWERLRRGEVFTGEFKRMSKDKRIVWIQGTYTPVCNENKEVIRVIKIALDITEKKRLAESLEDKNKELATVASKANAATYAKSIFLANMSHEIRTPLNSIIGITDTLAETKLDEQQRSYVEILQRANHQLMIILNDILDISKVEAGEFELHKKYFDLQVFIEDIISILNFRAREKGLFLTFTINSDVGRVVQGDPDRLRQVLMNLLNNGIKFTNKGEVFLQVSLNDTNKPGNLLFMVRDSGIGIKKNHFKDIFLPFTQADPKTTRRYGGTGLGLSITKSIVTLMEGKIWLESGEDKGSTFYFTVNLPFATAEKLLPKDLLEPRNSDDYTFESPSNPLKILIVDDVDDNRNLIGIYLKNTPHIISYAENGFDALELVKQTDFDIIFMDIQMPNMDGHEATRLIRKLEKDRKKKPAHIFACTANAFSEDVDRSYKSGCNLHLSKPIRKDVLLRSIRTVFTDSSYSN